VKSKHKRSTEGQNQDDVYVSLELFCGLDQKRLFVPRSITFYATTRDQGWSSYREEQGTRRGSHTWVEGCVSTTATSEMKRVELHRNIHAGREWEEWEVVMDSHTPLLVELRKDGFVGKQAAIEMRLRSQYPGWCCNCREARIEVNFDLMGFEMIQ
jgi:hypothetical protein